MTGTVAWLVSRRHASLHHVGLDASERLICIPRVGSETQGEELRARTPPPLTLKTAFLSVTPTVATFGRRFVRRCAAEWQNGINQEKKDELLHGPRRLVWRFGGADDESRPRDSRRPDSASVEVVASAAARELCEEVRRALWHMSRAWRRLCVGTDPASGDRVGSARVCDRVSFAACVRLGRARRCAVCARPVYVRHTGRLSRSRER